MLPAERYKPEAEVWVHVRDVGWCPGVVEGIGAWGSAQVRLRLPAGRGETVDTVMPDRLAVRVVPRVARAGEAG